MTGNKKNHLLRSAAITFNWITAALLLLNYLAERTSPSQHTLVAIFGLIYPMLIFVNLFFVTFWLLRKEAWLLLSLLVILIGLPHIRTNFGFHFGQNKTENNGIKVLCYNVQGFAEKNRAAFNPEIKANIFIFLLKEKADLVCLQEYSGKKVALFRNDDEDNFYFHSYYTRKGSKNTGLAIFSKYKIFNSNFLKFKGYRTFGIFTDLVANKDTLRLFNVHLASISLKQEDLDLLSKPPSTVWEKQNVRTHYLDIYRKLQKAFRLRQQQLDLVIRTIKSSPYPVVLCGDFNDTPSSNAYHRIAAVLNDAFVKKGSGLGATYAGPLPFLRIDYLFAGQQFKITSYKKYHIRFSDHFPISTTVEVLPEKD